MSKPALRISTSSVFWRSFILGAGIAAVCGRVGPAARAPMLTSVLLILMAGLIAGGPTAYMCSILNLSVAPPSLRLRSLSAVASFAIMPGVIVATIRPGDYSSTSAIIALFGGYGLAYGWYPTAEFVNNLLVQRRDKRTATFRPLDGSHERID